MTSMLQRKLFIFISKPRLSVESFPQTPKQKMQVQSTIFYHLSATKDINTLVDETERADGSASSGLKVPRFSEAAEPEPRIRTNKSFFMSILPLLRGYAFAAFSRLVLGFVLYIINSSAFFLFIN